MLMNLNEVKEYKISFIKTNTVLDKLYLRFNIEEKRLEYANGIPLNGIIQLVGTNGTGKSLLATDLAVNLQVKYPVIYITTETIGEFIYFKLKERAEILGIELDLNNLFIIDLTKEDSENILEKLFKEVSELTKSKNFGWTRFVIIDSLTAFYESLENKARSVVRRIYNFFKRWRYTGIFISQKRSSHEETTSEAAGGYAVAHIVDSTIVLTKKVIQTKWEEEDYKTKKGKLIRTIRVDDCRITPHITEELIFKIKPEGTIEIIGKRSLE